AIEDAGGASHRSCVEGQDEGGVAQGIGWARNEEYIYDDEGSLQTRGFLDSRAPVASALPMIDTVIVEVPNPRHPYGVRGVGETPIVPPMAAVANALANATGVRFTELPMSPPKVLKALDEARAHGAAKIWARHCLPMPLRHGEVAGGTHGGPLSASPRSPQVSPLLSPQALARGLASARILPHRLLHAHDLPALALQHLS